MGDEHTWRKVLQIIKNYEQPVVVVSATARTTRKLVAAAELALTDFGQAASMAIEIKDRHLLLIRNYMGHFDESKPETIQDLSEQCEEWIENRTELLLNYLGEITDSGELKPSMKDAIASIGEQLSSRLLVYCGSAYGLETTWIDARHIIKTDSDFGSANPDVNLIRQNTKQIASEVNSGRIPIMGGYYGETTDGTITTLGFEGSDYSASLIGSALDADGIEIWTDVSGIYTCDPRVVEEAYPIKKMSFREATEMAYFGAKILHPSTMNPAEEKQIPILVKNIFEPEHPGTVIQGEADTDGYAKAMTFLSNVSILSVTSPHTRMGYDFLAGIYKVLKDHHVTVNVVTTTEASISLALASDKISTTLKESLEKLGKVQKKEKLGIISLIGCSFSNMSSISDAVFEAIPQAELSMISYSSDKKNLNIVVPEEMLIPSVKSIHRNLFAQPVGQK